MSKIVNKKAYFEYHILKEFTAGVELLGSEVKSLRRNNTNIGDAFCFISNDEIFIKNMFIGKYFEATYQNHEERRTRKLLLHKSEIKDIFKRNLDQGITIIPLEVFTVKGRFKIKIGISQARTRKCEKV